jgi:hypothetical protein
MGCDLGWFSNVGCSLKGSRGGKKGKIKNGKGFKFTRSFREKNYSTLKRLRHSWVAVGGKMNKIH